MSKSASPVSVRVPLARIAHYGAPMLGSGFMGALLGVYLLKFATDVLLVPPSVVGLLLGAGFVWDALTDPLAGFLSDRTRSRLGRRRSWMFASAVPLGLFFFALWSPPRSLDGPLLVAWLALSLMLFFSAWTAMSVPHLALGVELTFDYDERSRVFGGRQLFDFAGILLAAGAVAALEAAADERELARRIALVAGLAAAALVILCAARTPERADHQGRGGLSAHTAFRDVFRNREARLLLAVFFLEVLGLALLLTLLPYATEYLLDQRGRTGLLIASTLVAALLFFPVWFPLARRFGKRDPWIASTLVKSVAMGALLFVDGEPFALLLCLTLVIGANQGAAMILGPSIKADVVDLDEFRTGERKEGAYFAVWNLAEKGAKGLSIAITGAVLDLAGFEPNASQGAEAEAAIRALLGGLPMALHVAAALLLLRFGLGRSEHASLRRSIESRRCGPA